MSPTRASPYRIEPELAAIMQRRTPAQRHAIARLLATSGDALDLAGWIVEQPDGDLATAAMVFWRLWSLPDEGGIAPHDLARRDAVLEAIVDRIRAGDFAPPMLAWDGQEAWVRTMLIGAPRAPGIALAEDEIPAALHGPFGADRPEPVWETFLDEDIVWDDVFDALWHRHPYDAGIADYLLGQDGDAWLAAIDDLAGGHADTLYRWMVKQPECPASAGDRMARIFGGDWAAAQGISLAGAALPEIRPVARPDDFAYFCLIRCRGGLIPTPRAAAIAAWREQPSGTLAWHDYLRPARSYAAPDDSRAATIVERFCYGGKYDGSRAQMDRCWRRFNIVTVAASVLLVALMRGGSPKAAIWVFFGIVGFVSVAQSSWKMGPAYRLLLWWVVAIGVSFALVALFRAIDLPR